MPSVTTSFPSMLFISSKPIFSGCDTAETRYSTTMPITANPTTKPLFISYSPDNLYPFLIPHFLQINYFHIITLSCCSNHGAQIIAYSNSSYQHSCTRLIHQGAPGKAFDLFFHSSSFITKTHYGLSDL